MRRTSRRWLARASVAVAAVTAVTACTGSSTPAPAGTTSASPPVSTAIVASSSPAVSPSSRATSRTRAPRTATSSAPRPSRTHAVVPHADRPVIVIDPGHSPTITATDPATGLNVSDYENEPEMADVFDVAERVKAALTADGYRVVMTKQHVDDRVSLGQRAEIANEVHADLALSIHDQAGPNGGIAFDGGNANVYYQSVGNYRETPSGKKVYFTDSAVARVSKRYGEIFQAQRSSVEHHAITLLGNTGYDLGSRGLPAGNIWFVQLLSHVPWIYNEAGGNSAGRSGLDNADKQRYADGLVAGVEHCIAPPG